MLEAILWEILTLNASKMVVKVNLREPLALDTLEIAVNQFSGDFKPFLVVENLKLRPFVLLVYLMGN